MKHSVKSILWMRRGVYDQSLLRLGSSVIALLVFTLALFVLQPSSPYRLYLALSLSILYLGAAVLSLSAAARSRGRFPAWSAALVADAVYATLLLALFNEYALLVFAVLVLPLLGHGILHGRKAVLLFAVCAVSVLLLLENFAAGGVDKESVFSVAAMLFVLGLLSGWRPVQETDVSQTQDQRSGRASLKKCHMVLLGNSSAIRECRALARREGAKIKHVIKLNEAGLEFSTLLQRYNKYHLVVYDGSVCPRTGSCVPELPGNHRRPVVVRIAAGRFAEHDAHLHIPADSSADSVLSVLRKAYVLSNNGAVVRQSPAESAPAAVGAQQDPGSRSQGFAPVAKAAPPSDMVFDLNFVDRLRRVDSSPAYISEILSYSLTDIETQLESLQDNFVLMDVLELRGIVERARGAAALIGAHRLGRAFKNFLEMYKTENSVKEISHENEQYIRSRLFEPLLVEYQRLYDKVTDYLNHEVHCT